MSPTEKLTKIHELTSHALHNPTPLATLMKIVHIASGSHEDKHPETPLMRHIAAQEQYAGLIPPAFMPSVFPSETVKGNRPGWNEIEMADGAKMANLARRQRIASPKIMAVLAPSIYPAIAAAPDSAA